MFSKTRIFYYDNTPNTTTVGDYTDFAIEVPVETASYPYLTVSVPASKHGWSYIPLNSYGLFCTFGELQSLVENNDSFIPRKLELTLGHTIPLARYPSTANSTQLSFNNTIYSLIACNEDNYINVNQNIPQDEIASFARTFDGVDAVFGTARSTLPKRDMFFRIPYHSYVNTAVTTASTQASNIVSGAAQNTVSTVADSDRFEYSQTIPQLIDSYIPELLQNNDNVYTLYPGENQYQKEFTDYKPEYCALDCSGPSFNETVWQLDQRLNTLINRDMTGRSANNILALPVMFTMKGNNSDSIPANIRGPTNVAATNPTQAQINYNFNKLADIYLGREGTDDYTNLLPKLFVKGVPIVDGDNNLVPHTFCCTITWTLHIETTPRSNMNVNRLQWRMTYPYLRQRYATGTGNAKVSDYVHLGNFAKKPFRHNVFKRTPMMRYNNMTEAQITAFDRITVKSAFKDVATDIQYSSSAAPDDIAPSRFGYSLPYGAGWYEGTAFASSTVIPTAITTSKSGSTGNSFETTTSNSMDVAAN